MTNIIYDGKTTKSIDNLPPEAWTFLKGGTTSDIKIELLQNVSWLYRAIQLIGQGVASMPFVLYKGEVEFDNSKQWENIQ